MSKPDLKFSAGILVTMSRAELEKIRAVVPPGVSLSQWCRQQLLDATKPKLGQLSLFTEAS